MRRIGRVIRSPWWILVAFIIGWGPVFVAELVRRRSPAVNASYAPQEFAMHWIPIIILCSVLVVALTLFQVVRFIVYLFGGHRP